MMPSLLCLLFSDAFSDHACVFLCVSMHLEAELLTHEEIPTQCGMATQEWMATQYDQASDTCMANRPNMRSNPTAHRTQPSLPASQVLAPCARQPGFRASPVTSPSFRSKVYAASGPEAWLSRAGSQCLRCWERWLSPACCRVASQVQSVGHARVNPELNQTLTHTTPGGACPTPLAQCGPICTRTSSHPRRPMPLALITPTA